MTMTITPIAAAPADELAAVRGDIKTLKKRGNQTIDELVYIRPSAATVAKLVDNPDYGIEAATRRWHWLSPRTLQSLARAGRVTNGAVKRTGRRAITPEREQEIVDAVFSLGSVRRVQKATGHSPTFIVRLLSERGITDYPRVSTAERCRLSHESRRARRAA